VFALNFSKRHKHAGSAIPALAATRGCIINMASVAGMGAIPLGSAYCSSKAGVILLTQTAALELRSAGIRLNAICPGFIQTEMVERLIPEFEAGAGVNFDEFGSRLQGRIGMPQEVAQVAVFLASDNASFVSGAAYTVDNGLTASVV